MGKRRSHGKVDKLPLKLRMQVERRLIDGETYVAVSEWLKSLGHDISFMSVYRYGNPFLKRYEKVVEAKYKATILLDHINK